MLAGAPGLLKNTLCATEPKAKVTVVPDCTTSVSGPNIKLGVAAIVMPVGPLVGATGTGDVAPLELLPQATTLAVAMIAIAERSPEEREDLRMVVHRHDWW